MRSCVSRPAISLLLVAFFASFYGFCGVRPQHTAQDMTLMERGFEPVLGWSSWSFLRKQPTEAMIKAEALAMHDSGLQKAGFVYVDLDDFWYQCPDKNGPRVDAYGRWVIDASRFPPHDGVNGIESTANYIHSLGLKFGLYVTPGISKRAVAENTKIKGTSYTADQIAEPDITEPNYNCGGMDGIDLDKPGAQAFLNSWADEFASWGVDLIKLDGIRKPNDNYEQAIAWYRAFQQTGRPFIFYDPFGGSFAVQGSSAATVMKFAERSIARFTFSDRHAGDIECYRCEKGGSSYPLTDWQNVQSRFYLAAIEQPYSGYGHFNDYDSVELGNGEKDGLTPAERQTQLSLWAMAASPIILGTDLTHLDPLDGGYLKNPAVLAIDQDGIAAKLVATYDHDHSLVYAKSEPDGSVIIGLFNLADGTRQISVPAFVAGLPAGRKAYSLQDVWGGRTVQSTGPTIKATVPAHGVVLYKTRSTSPQGM